MNQPLPRTEEAIRREIGGGEAHTLEIPLRAGEFLHARLEQEGVDVILELHRPGASTAEPLLTADSLRGAWGREDLFAIVPEAGTYRLRVVAPEGSRRGRYTLPPPLHHAAGERDRRVVAADAATRAALARRPDGGAVTAWREVLERWTELDEPAFRALALHHLFLAHGAGGPADARDLHLALALGDRAIELYRREGERALLAAALQAVARARFHAEPERAIEQLEEARALLVAMEDAPGLALVLGNLGGAHSLLGRTQTALALFDEAFGVLESTGTEIIQATLRADLGDVLLAMNRPGPARAAYERALEIHRRHGRGLDAALDLVNLAHAARRQGDAEAAAEAAAEALGLLGEDGPPRERALALNARGQIRRQGGDLAAARADFEAGLELARGAGDIDTEAVLLLELGYAETLGGAPEAGLELYRRVLESPPSPRRQASAQARVAQALHRLGRNAEAWENIAPALEAVEARRATTLRPDLRAAYFALRQEYYKIAFDILMDLHAAEPRGPHLARAFELNERRLARELLENLALAGPAPRASAGEELLARERELEGRLAELAARPPLDAERYRERVDDLLARLHRARGEIRRAVGPPAPEIVTLEETRREILDPDSLLLIYLLGEEGGHLWAIPGGGEPPEVHRLPPRREIEEPACALAENLPRFGRESRERAAAAAGRLAELLLAPVGQRLVEGRPGEERRLVILAEGALQNVPFGALPHPAGGTRSEPLLRRHEIVYLPSLSTLANARRAAAGRGTPERSLAIFADPVFQRRDPRVTGGDTGEDPATAEGPLSRSADRLGVDPWQRLERSRDEARAIAELAADGSPLLALDFEASRETFLGAGLHRFRVLHLATHALADPEYPELSGLVLSQVDAAGRPRDGFLRAFQIARLHLPVDLAVLSACQTGIGEDVPGEGLASLTRAFFNAGAGRVVASLWKVGDDPTAELMIRFYRAHLKEGRTPAAALRQARLALLDDAATAAPHAWAGFLFHGDWRPPQR